MDIEKIKSELKRRRINYDKLSEMTGISKSAIAKIMNGCAKNPRHETVRLIERAVGFEENAPLVSRYLTEDEEELVTGYKKLSDKDKNLILELLKSLNK